MTTEIIVLLVLLIVAGLIIFKITKSIFKAIFLASTALTLIILILGSFIVLDANDFRKNFQTQPSLFLLEDQGKIITAFSGALGEEFKPSYVSEEQLASYDINNPENTLGDNYKLFLIKRQTLDSVDKIEGEGPSLTRQDIDTLLDSETPVDDFIKIQVGDVPESQLPKLRQDVLENAGVKDDAEFKGALFGAAFAAAMGENPLFLFEQYKNQNIVIYPETAMFKFLKKMPLSLLGNIIKVEEVN